MYPSQEVERETENSTFQTEFVPWSKIDQGANPRKILKNISLANLTYDYIKTRHNDIQYIDIWYNDTQQNEFNFNT
jgi:hypothetical protein